MARPSPIQCAIRPLLCVALFASTAALAEPLAGDMPDAPTSPTVAARTGQNFVGMLASASLAQQGVTNPTPADVGVAEAAVESMRASGMGWGAIANSLGVNLGSLVSAENRSPHASLKRARQDARRRRTGHRPLRWQRHHRGTGPQRQPGHGRGR
jgi:hypothetical protein